MAVENNLLKLFIIKNHPFLFFFQIWSVFGKKMTPKNTLSTLFKLFLTLKFTKIQLALISCISRHSNELIISFLNHFSDKF